jgi:dephospho-CoA kinase
LRRNRIGENISFEKFKELEEIENSHDEEKQQLNKCLEMADKIIENNGIVEELYKKIDEILSKL